MTRPARYVSMSSGRSRIIAYGFLLRVLARRDGDVAEVLARGAVLVHVAVRPHADHVDRTDEAPRRVQRLVVASPAPAPATTAATSCAPRLRARWQTTTVGEPGRDRRRGVHDRRARGAAAVGDLVPPAAGSVTPEPARDRHLVRVLHLEHRHAVDVLGLEAGVVERELDRLDGGVARSAGRCPWRTADGRCRRSPPGPGCGGRGRGRRTSPAPI